MITDAHIANAALGLVDTPWHHQGRTPGVGCDCVGVGVLAGREVGLDVVDELTYARDPDPKVLLSYMEANCRQVFITNIDVVPVGYGMLFWFVNREHPQHFGIKTQRGMVHARNRKGGNGKVLNQTIDTYYSKRLHSVWRYKWQR